MLLIAIIAFIGLLFVLVVAHEFGHLVAAKKAGCRVEEFGFGFPPRLFSFMVGETRYSLNLLPLGGFVKIEGEDMQEDTPGPTSFGHKSVGWRTVILAAGVFMNVVLAWVLLSVQGVVGIPTIVTAENAQQLTRHQTFILAVSEGSPAQAAGLAPYDRVALLDGIPEPSVERVQNIVEMKAGQSIGITIDRQGQQFSYELPVRDNPPAGEGPLGVSLAETGLYTVPWWQAPWRGLVRTGDMLYAIGQQFGVIISSVLSGDSLGGGLTGPVGIAVYTREVTELGLGYLLEFAALISLNLAIINILPLPALDGGRIAFVLIEGIRGRRLPAAAEKMTHTIGFIALILLLVVITLRDIGRFF